MFQERKAAIREGWNIYVILVAILIGLGVVGYVVFKVLMGSAIAP